jgi:hypothetical protein
MTETFLMQRTQPDKYTLVIRDTDSLIDFCWRSCDSLLSFMILEYIKSIFFCANDRNRFIRSVAPAECEVNIEYGSSGKRFESRFPFFFTET